MRHIKKLLLVLMLGISLFSFGGCNGKANEGEDKLRVITTIFPIYDWTSNLIGNNDKIELDLLLDNGVDMHSYQPTVEDIVAIKNCDLFIYVGGESDEWIEDILSEEDTSTAAVNLMDILGDLTLEEEIKEGMSLRKSSVTEIETDEHIWLSLRNAMICLCAIKDALVELDNSNSDTYNINYQKYRNELESLDDYYSHMFEQVSQKEIVVADRFPFVYMTRDYGIDYYAAFPGCYADASASFETLFYLAQKVDEGRLETILCTESSDESIPIAVEKITKDTQNIVKMDSMQSIGIQDVMNGTSYLDIMENNLQILYEGIKWHR